MDFSQSLTIRILGDSSEFRNELTEVTQQVDSLESRLRQFSSSLDGLSDLGSRLASLTGAVDEVRGGFESLTERIRGLSRMPVSLNVQPALQSLMALIGLIDAAAARLAALHARAAMPIGIPGFGSGGGTSMPMLPRLASGGMVNGPAGVDSVPAMLTAGEFVIREPVVRQLGSDFFAALNNGLSNSTPVSQGERGGRGDLGETVEPASIANTYHYGGVTIQVRETADLNGLIRDMRHQGFHLKNRRG